MIKNLNASEIAKRNDLCRTTLMGCKVVMTPGVAHSSDKDTILSAVRTFNSFTPDNDPHREHDFGSFEVNGTKCFWKFDYYDQDFNQFCENGNRVLTIMLASEY